MVTRNILRFKITVFGKNFYISVMHVHVHGYYTEVRKITKVGVKTLPKCD